MICALVQLALAKQHKILCTFVYRFNLIDMYITAAVPYITDIINPGHNVRVQKNVLQASLLKKMSGVREKVHIFSNSVSNTVNMDLPFTLVIKNNTKVTMFWNLLYYLWI